MFKNSSIDNQRFNQGTVVRQAGQLVQITILIGVRRSTFLRVGSAGSTDRSPGFQLIQFGRLLNMSLPRHAHHRQHRHQEPQQFPPVTPHNFVLLPTCFVCRMNNEVSVNLDIIPAREGFFFPPEWHPHVATWLSWPHTEASWTRERQELMFPAYIEFIKAIAESEAGLYQCP